jgi:hypothetical protein
LVGLSLVRVSQTICLGWLPTSILLISASQVARIIGMSHQHPTHRIFIRETLFIECEDKWWTGRKPLQNIYLIKDWYSAYITNFQTSVASKHPNVKWAKKELSRNFTIENKSMAEKKFNIITQ